MCGICGFFNPSGGGTIPNREEVLRDMTDRITHRGPDGDGYFLDRHAALGMRRLAIIDLQTGEQPQFNEGKNVVVVFNGEIYNFAELKDKLKGKGHQFKTSSDTEVLVHLYEEEGEDFVDQLNGMFAIALYDISRNKLVLVRDRLGIKPLHYSQVGPAVVFGSELKSLLLYPGIKRRLSPFSLYNYMTFEYVSAPRSIYLDIKKVMPGQMMVVDDSGIRFRKYWKPAVTKIPAKESDLIDQIRETFFSAVQYRLISDVPLGVFLSGGVDSTVITGVASKFQKPIDTFSIGFKEESFNELGYAKIASDFFQTRHHEMVLSYKKAIDLLPTIMGYLDEPLADASIIPTYLVSHLSRQEITVALSGDGGDELFLGYDTYKAFKYARFARLIPPFIRSMMSRMSSLLPASSRRLSLEFKLKKFLSGLQYKPEYSNYIWWGAYHPDVKSQIFTPGFLDQLKDFPEFEPILSYQKDLEKIAHPLDRVNYLDLHLYLQDDLLPKVDRMSMATSLEVRVPFLDHRMVELALSIENKYRMKGLDTKYILKKALSDFIPPRLKKRPKIGFDIPLGPWLRNDLKDYMVAMLDEKKLRESGIFNTLWVNRIVDEHLKGKHNHRQLLWPLIIFQNWQDQYRPELP